VKILAIFQEIVRKVGSARLRTFIGRGIMDTSSTKVIDNAIIGFSALTREVS